MQIPSNSIKDIRRFMKQELCALYDDKALSHIAQDLFEAFADISGPVFFAEPERTVSESVLLKINRAVKRLKTGMPLAYVLGKSVFCGMELYVDSSVLIPRPETEELVALTAEAMKDKEAPLIADACTGSGCIALALERVIPGAVLYAFDKSAAALDVARRNATLYGSAVQFFEADLLNYQCHFEMPFLDLIVSNPPYVRHSEQALMQHNVLGFEPHEALFVDDAAPLVFYDALAILGQTLLKPGGMLFCEINEALGEATVNVFMGMGYGNVLVHKDFNSRDRFVSCIKL